MMERQDRLPAGRSRAGPALAIRTVGKAAGCAVRRAGLPKKQSWRRAARLRIDVADRLGDKGTETFAPFGSLRQTGRTLEVSVSCCIAAGSRTARAVDAQPGFVHRMGRELEGLIASIDFEEPSRAKLAVIAGPDDVMSETATSHA